jgi:hypothetical protein
VLFGEVFLVAVDVGLVGMLGLVVPLLRLVMLQTLATSSADSLACRRVT